MPRALSSHHLPACRGPRVGTLVSRETLNSPHLTGVHIGKVSMALLFLTRPVLFPSARTFSSKMRRRSATSDSSCICGGALGLDEPQVTNTKCLAFAMGYDKIWATQLPQCRMALKAAPSMLRCVD